MSKVLLIKSFTSKSNKGEGVPLSFLYLSAFLKKAGHKVKVLDLSLYGKNDFDRIEKEISFFSPEIIGFTCNTHERFSVLDLINFTKNKYPNKLIVVGGPHIALLGREMMLYCKNIDIGVYADGEQAIVDIANHYKDRNKLRNITGIYLRDNNEIIKTDTKKIVRNLDEYGHPAIDVVNLEDYSLVLPLKERQKAISICTSRGCPFRCSFCAATRVNYGLIRFHSAQWVIDEVNKIQEIYGNEHVIFFYDDHFLLDKARVFEFCNLVKKNNLKFKWGCYSRVDIVDDEILRRIKGGVHNVVFWYRIW